MSNYVVSVTEYTLHYSFELRCKNYYDSHVVIDVWKGSDLKYLMKKHWCFKEYIKYYVELHNYELKDLTDYILRTVNKK